MPRKVFISAVSLELKSYRVNVDQWLRKSHHCEPVCQELFDFSDQRIVELLREEIAACDAFVCLVGHRYGAAPTAPLDGYGERSWTQLEYLFAREQGLPVYRFLTTAATPTDHPLDESPELQERQRQYRRDVVQDLNYREFASVDQLRAEIAELRFPWEPRFADEKPCNLPPSIGRLFKGRDEFLATLREKLTAAGRKAAAITAKHAIHGLGGVGKTRLAVEYGHQYRDEFSALLYVYADSPSALISNLAQLTGVLKLSDEGLLEEQARAQCVVDWLGAHPGWLLLVDNVDTEPAVQAVVRLLGALHGGQVVITSRIAQWPHLVEALELDVLAPDDGVALLFAAATKRQRTPHETDEARALVLEVDGLALALTQAAAYIDRYRISFAEYRKRLQASMQTLLGWHDAKAMTYPKSVAATWNTSVDQLTPPAKGLLELLSFLAPDPIPREWFTAAETAPHWSAAGIPAPEEALAELADFSLAQLTGEAVQFHRLVQEITRGRLSQGEQTERLQGILAVVNAFRFGAEAYDVRSWPRWIPAAPHVDLLVQRADARGVAEPTSRLMNALGLFYATRMRLGDAERLYRAALSNNEGTVGEHHPNVASCLNNLAQLLQDTNRLAEAEPLMRRVVTIFEKSYGETHPNVATALNNLAQLLMATNRLAEAEPLMRRALALDEQSFGPEHPNVAIRLNNLALLLYSLNRLAEAEPLMARVVTIMERSYGETHPNVATALNNLALLLQDTNRLAEAESRMRRVVTIFEKSYGETHPNVATALNNLAQLLQAANRLAEAEPLMRRALALGEQSFGPEHPDVATALNNLAQLLMATNRLAEAEPLMRRALALDEQSFGPEHPNVARDLNNLAQLLKDTNRLAEAEPLMARVVTIFEKSYGETHPNVATALNNLAQLLQDTNRLAEAEPLMRRALALDEQSFGPEHPNVAIRLNNLAQLLQATNRLAEAEPLMARHLEIFAQFGRRTRHEHPHFRAAIRNYELLLNAMDLSIDEIARRVQSALHGEPEA